MAFKTITVTETAYRKIKKLKFEGESFSELFVRLVKEKSPMDRLFGAMPMSDKEAKETRKKLKKIREDLSNDIEARRKRLFK